EKKIFDNKYQPTRFRSSSDLRFHTFHFLVSPFRGRCSHPSPARTHPRHLKAEHPEVIHQRSHNSSTRLVGGYVVENPQRMDSPALRSVATIPVQMVCIPL